MSTKTNKYQVVDTTKDNSKEEIKELDVPLYEEIIIDIYDVFYGKHKNITVIFEYKKLLFQFSVFWNNRYSTVDESFSFKILDEDKQLVPPNHQLIAKFDLTKTGYLKCLSARIKE